MDKRYAHHLWTLIRPLKVWYLLVLTLVSAAITISALRQNNLRMVELRQAVYTADEQAGDVEAALQELRKHVYAHMNTNLASGGNAVYPPIQLKYTYQRLREAEKARVQQAAAQIYTDAQTYCERLYPGSFSGGPRVPCIENYVASHQVKEQSIPDALYKFDFQSPTWSPDVAGFGVLTTAFMLLVLIVRAALGRLLKKYTD